MHAPQCPLKLIIICPTKGKEDDKKNGTWPVERQSIAVFPLEKEDVNVGILVGVCDLDEHQRRHRCPDVEGTVKCRPGKETGIF